MLRVPVRQRSPRRHRVRRRPPAQAAPWRCPSVRSPRAARSWRPPSDWAGPSWRCPTLKALSWPPGAASPANRPTDATRLTTSCREASAASSAKTRSTRWRRRRRRAEAESATAASRASKRARSGFPPWGGATPRAPVARAQAWCRAREAAPAPRRDRAARTARSCAQNRVRTCGPGGAANHRLRALSPASARASVAGPPRRATVPPLRARPSVSSRPSSGGVRRWPASFRCRWCCSPAFSAGDGLRFRRVGPAVAQLRLVRSRGLAIALLALDADAEIERFSGGRWLLHHGSHPCARFADARLVIREQREVVRGDRIAGRRAERTPQVVLGLFRLTDLRAAFACVDQRNLRRLVQRVFQHLLEFGDRLACPAGSAEVRAPVLANFGVVGRERQALPEIFLGLRALAQHRVDEAVNVVELRIRRIERLRGPELLERDIHLAAPVVAGGELGANLRALQRCRVLRLHRWRFGRRRKRRRCRLRRAAGEGCDDEQGPCKTFHADDSRVRGFQRATASGMRVASRCFVRSFTCPASWPQAASMS